MISYSILATLEDKLYAEVQIPPMSSAPSVLSIAGISEADIFREEVRMVCSYDVQGLFCIWTGLRNSTQRTSWSIMLLDEIIDVWQEPRPCPSRSGESWICRNLYIVSGGGSCVGYTNRTRLRHTTGVDLPENKLFGEDVQTWVSPQTSGSANCRLRVGTMRQVLNEVRSITV